MTRTENSRSLNQKLLCAAAPGRDERGKREEEGKEKVGEKKKKAKVGTFLPSRFCAFTFLPVIIKLYCIVPSFFGL
jgi:hypothetical protein